MIIHNLYLSLSVYRWVIFITYILLIFPSTRNLSITKILNSGVAPFVNLFRGKYSRFGGFDLSLLYAMIAILFIQQILIQI